MLTSNTPLGWFFGLMVGGGVASLLVIAVTWLFLKGVGIWGVTMPVAWGFAIINFVWWIGIGHAGTLISAILLLFKQTLAQLDQPLRRGDDDLRRRLRRHVPADPRRPSVAGVTGCSRIPNTMNVWPQFRSPLMWDVFAVSTYATISVVFWYIGMIPDFGTLRDRATMPVRPSTSTASFAGLARFGPPLDAL